MYTLSNQLLEIYSHLKDAVIFIEFVVIDLI